MRELYVYYRVREADAVAAEADAKRLQSVLRSKNAGLLTRLLRRPVASDGRSTVSVNHVRGDPSAKSQLAN